ncbi:MAG: hypothetical protein HYS41_04535, partial [Candidatus Omnitrophica bacterium]|nr:hypothetical protein [Candidatus Omnitrophota bacterium]
LRLYNVSGERTGTAYRWDDTQAWRTPHAFTTQGQVVLFDAGQTYAEAAVQGYGISLPDRFVQLGYIRIAADGTVADLKVSGEEQEVKAGRPTFRTFRIWNELMGRWKTVLGPKVENLSTPKESVYAFPKEHKVKVERFGGLTEMLASELFTGEGRQAGTAYLVDERRGRWERTGAYNAEGYASFFAPGVELKAAAAGAYFSADGYQLGYLKADDTGAAQVTEVAGDLANRGGALEYRTLIRRRDDLGLEKTTLLKDTDLSNRLGQSIFVRPLDKRAAVMLPAKDDSREAREVMAGDLFNGRGQRLGRAYDLKDNGQWAVTQAEDSEGRPLFLAPNERLTGEAARFARNLQGFQAERLEADETGGVWNVDLRRQAADTAFLWSSSAGGYLPVKGIRQTIDKKEGVVFDLNEKVTVHQLKSWAPGQPREWKTYDRKLILFEDGASFTGSFDGKRYAPGTTLYDRGTQTWVFVPRSLIDTHRAIHHLSGEYEAGPFILRDPFFERGEYQIGENLGRIGVADSSAPGGVRWVSKINQEVPAGFTRSARFDLKDQDGVTPFYPTVLRALEGADGKPILAMEPAEGTARLSIAQTGYQVTALPEELRKSLSLKRGTEFWVELDHSVYQGKVLGESAEGGWRVQVTKIEAAKSRYLAGRDPGTGKLIFVEEGESYLSQLLRDKLRYDGSKDPGGYSTSETIPTVGVYTTFRTAGLSRKEDTQHFKVQEDPATGAYQKQGVALGELVDIVGEGRFESVLVASGVQSLKLKGKVLETPNPSAQRVSLTYTVDLTNDPTKLTDFRMAPGTPLAKESRFYLLNRQRAEVFMADPRGSSLKIFDPLVSVTATVERNLFTEFKVLGASGEAAQEGLAVDPENSAHHQRFTTFRGNDGTRYALAGAVVRFTILDSAGQDELSVTGRVILTHPDADFEVEALTRLGPEGWLHWGNLNDLTRTDQTGELKLTQDGINTFFGVRPVLGLRAWKDQLVREEAGIEVIRQAAGESGNGLVHRRMTQPSSYEARVDGDWRKAHLMSYVPGHPNGRGLVLAEMPHRVEPDDHGRTALAGSNTPEADGRLEIEHPGAFDWWLAKDGTAYYQGPLSGGWKVPMAIPAGGREQPDGRILDAKGELVGVALPVVLEGSERTDGKRRFTRRINDAQIITVEGLAVEKPRLWLSSDLKGDLALRIPLHRSQLATRVYTDSYALPMTVGALGLSSLPGGLFRQVERIVFVSKAAPGEVELTRVSETNLGKPVELEISTEYPLASLPYQKVHYQAGSRVVLHPSGAMWLADGLAQKSFVHEGKRVTVHYTSTQDPSLPMVISRVEDQAGKILARYAYQGDQLYFEKPEEALALSRTLKALGDEFLLGWEVGTPDQWTAEPDPITHAPDLPDLLVGKLLFMEMENPQFKGVVPVIARVWIKPDGQVKERLGQFYDPATGRQGILADIEGQLIFKGAGDVWTMNDSHKLVLEAQGEPAPAAAASPFGEPAVDEMDRLIQRLEEVGNEMDEWLRSQPDLYHIIREVKLAEDKETGLILARGEVTGGLLFNDFTGRYVYFRPGETKGGFYISQQDPIRSPWEPKAKRVEISYQFLPNSPKGPWIDVTKDPYAEAFKEDLKKEGIEIKAGEPKPEPTQPGIPTGGYESPLRHLGSWKEWLSNVGKKARDGELETDAIMDDFISFMATKYPSRVEEFKDRAKVSRMLESVIGEITSLPAADFQTLGDHLAAKGQDQSVRPFMDFVKYIAYRNMPRNPKGFRDHQEGLSCVGVAETLTAIGQALGGQVSAMLTRGVDGRTDKAGHVMVLWDGDALDFAIPQDGSDQDGTLWHNLEGVARKSGLTDPRREVQVLVLDSRTGKWGYQPFLALFDEEGNLKEDLRRDNQRPVGFKTEVVVAFESVKRYQLPELTDLMELSIEHMKAGDRQQAVLILTGEDVLHRIDYTRGILEGLLAVEEGKYQALEDLTSMHEFLQDRRNLIKGILDGTVVRVEDRGGVLVSISKAKEENSLAPAQDFHPIITPTAAAEKPKSPETARRPQEVRSIFQGTDGFIYDVSVEGSDQVLAVRVDSSSIQDGFLWRAYAVAKQNEKAGWLYDVEKNQLVRELPKPEVTTIEPSVQSYLAQAYPWVAERLNESDVDAAELYAALLGVKEERLTRAIVRQMDRWVRSVSAALLLGQSAAEIESLYLVNPAPDSRSLWERGEDAVRSGALKKLSPIKTYSMEPYLTAEQKTKDESETRTPEFYVRSGMEDLHGQVEGIRKDLKSADAQLSEWFSAIKAGEGADGAERLAGRQMALVKVKLEKVETELGRRIRKADDRLDSLDRVQKQLELEYDAPLAALQSATDKLNTLVGPETALGKLDRRREALQERYAAWLGGTGISSGEGSRGLSEDALFGKGLAGFLGTARKYRDSAEKLLQDWEQSPDQQALEALVVKGEALAEGIKGYVAQGSFKTELKQAADRLTTLEKEFANLEDGLKKSPAVAFLASEQKLQGVLGSVGGLALYRTFADQLNGLRKELGVSEGGEKALSQKVDGKLGELLDRLARHKEEVAKVFGAEQGPSPEALSGLKGQADALTKDLADFLRGPDAQGSLKGLGKSLLAIAPELIEATLRVERWTSEGRPEDQAKALRQEVDKVGGKFQQIQAAYPITKLADAAGELDQETRKAEAVLGRADQPLKEFSNFRAQWSEFQAAYGKAFEPLIRVYQGVRLQTYQWLARAGTQDRLLAQMIQDAPKSLAFSDEKGEETPYGLDQGVSRELGALLYRGRSEDKKDLFVEVDSLAFRRTGRFYVKPDQDKLEADYLLVASFQNKDGHPETLTFAIREKTRDPSNGRAVTGIVPIRLLGRARWLDERTLDQIQFPHPATQAGQAQIKQEMARTGLLTAAYLTTRTRLADDSKPYSNNPKDVLTVVESARSQGGEEKEIRSWRRLDPKRGDQWVEVVLLQPGLSQRVIRRLADSGLSPARPDVQYVEEVYFDEEKGTPKLAARRLLDAEGKPVVSPLARDLLNSEGVDSVRFDQGTRSLLRKQSAEVRYYVLDRDPKDPERLQVRSIDELRGLAADLPGGGRAIRFWSKSGGYHMESASGRRVWQEVWKFSGDSYLSFARDAFGNLEEKREDAYNVGFPDEARHYNLPVLGALEKEGRRNLFFPKAGGKEEIYGKLVPVFDKDGKLSRYEMRGYLLDRTGESRSLQRKDDDKTLLFAVVDVSSGAYAEKYTEEVPWILRGSAVNPFRWVAAPFVAATIADWASRQTGYVYGTWMRPATFRYSVGFFREAGIFVASGGLGNLYELGARGTAALVARREFATQIGEKGASLEMATLAAEGAARKELARWTGKGLGKHLLTGQGFLGKNLTAKFGWSRAPLATKKLAGDLAKGAYESHLARQAGRSLVRRFATQLGRGVRGTFFSGNFLFNAGQTYYHLSFQLQPLLGAMSNGIQWGLALGDVRLVNDYGRAAWAGGGVLGKMVEGFAGWGEGSVNFFAQGGWYQNGILTLQILVMAPIGQAMGTFFGEAIATKGFLAQRGLPGHLANMMVDVGVLLPVLEHAFTNGLERFGLSEGPAQFLGSMAAFAFIGAYHDLIPSRKTVAAQKAVETARALRGLRSAPEKIQAGVEKLNEALREAGVADQPLSQEQISDWTKQLADAAQQGNLAYNRKVSGMVQAVRVLVNAAMVQVFEGFRRDFNQPLSGRQERARALAAGRERTLLRSSLDSLEKQGGGDLLSQGQLTEAKRLAEDSPSTQSSRAPASGSNRTPQSRIAAGVQALGPMRAHRSGEITSGAGGRLAPPMTPAERSNAESRAAQKGPESSAPEAATAKPRKSMLEIRRELALSELQGADPLAYGSQEALEKRLGATDKRSVGLFNQAVGFLEGSDPYFRPAKEGHFYSREQVREAVDSLNKRFARAQPVNSFAIPDQDGKTVSFVDGHGRRIVMDAGDFTAYQMEVRANRHAEKASGAKTLNEVMKAREEFRSEMKALKDRGLKVDGKERAARETQILMNGVERLPEDELIRTASWGKDGRYALPDSVKDRASQRIAELKNEPHLKVLEDQSWWKKAMPGRQARVEEARQAIEEVAKGGEGQTAGPGFQHRAAKAVGGISKIEGLIAQGTDAYSRIAEYRQKAQEAEKAQDWDAAGEFWVQASEIGQETFRVWLTETYGRVDLTVPAQRATAQIFAEGLYRTLSGNANFAFKPAQIRMADAWMAGRADVEKVKAFEEQAGGGKTLGAALIGFMERIHQPDPAKGSNFMLFLPTNDEVGAKLDTEVKLGYGFSNRQAFNFAGYRTLDLPRALERARQPGNEAAMDRLEADMKNPSVMKVTTYDALAHAGNLFLIHPGLNEAIKSVTVAIADESHLPFLDPVEAIVGQAEKMPEGLAEYLDAAVDVVEGWRQNRAVKEASPDTMSSAGARMEFLKSNDPMYVVLEVGGREVIVPNEALKSRFESEIGSKNRELLTHLKPGDYLKAMQLLNGELGTEKLVSTRLLVAWELEKNDQFRRLAAKELGGETWLKDGKWDLDVLDNELIPLYFGGELPTKGTGAYVKPNELVPYDPTTGPQWERVQHDPMANWAAAKKFNGEYPTADGRLLVDPGAQTFQKTSMATGTLDPLAMMVTGPESKTRLLLMTATHPETVEFMFNMKLTVFSQSLFELKNGELVVGSPESGLGTKVRTVQEIDAALDVINFVRAWKAKNPDKSLIIILPESGKVQKGMIQGMEDLRAFDKIHVVLDTPDAGKLLQAGRELGQGRQLLITNRRAKQAFDPTDAPAGTDLIAVHAEEYSSLDLAQMIRRVNRVEGQTANGEAHLFYGRRELAKLETEFLGSPKEQQPLAGDLDGIFALEKNRLEGGGLPSAQRNVQDNLDLLKKWKNPSQPLTLNERVKLLGEVRRVKENSESLVHTFSQRVLRRMTNNAFKALLREVKGNAAARQVVEAQYRQFLNDQSLYGEEAITGETLRGLDNYEGIYQGWRESLLGKMKDGKDGTIGRLKSLLPGEVAKQVDKLFMTDDLTRYDSLARSVEAGTETRGALEIGTVAEAVVWARRTANWLTSRRAGPLSKPLEARLSGTARTIDQAKADPKSAALAPYLTANNMVGAAGQLTLTGRMVLALHHQYQDEEDSALKGWITTLASDAGYTAAEGDLFLFALKNFLNPLSSSFADPERYRQAAQVVDFFKGVHQGQAPLFGAEAIGRALTEPAGIQGLAAQGVEKNSAAISGDLRDFLELGEIGVDLERVETSAKELGERAKETTNPQDRAVLEIESGQVKTEEAHLKEQLEQKLKIWTPEKVKELARANGVNPEVLLALVEPRLARWANVPGVDLLTAWKDLIWAAQGTGQLAGVKELADYLDKPLGTLEQIVQVDEEKQKKEPPLKANQRLASAIQTLQHEVDRQQNGNVKEVLKKAEEKARAFQDKKEPEDPQAVEKWMGEFKERLPRLMAPGAGQALLTAAEAMRNKETAQEAAGQIVQSIVAYPSAWHKGLPQPLVEWVQSRLRNLGVTGEGLTESQQEELKKAIAGKAHLLKVVASELVAQAKRLAPQANADQLVQLLTLLVKQVSPTVEDPAGWSKSLVHQMLAGEAAKGGKADAALSHDFEAAIVPGAVLFNAKDIRARLLEQVNLTPIQQGLFLQLLPADPGLLADPEGRELSLALARGQAAHDPAGSRGERREAVREARQAAMKNQIWGMDKEVRQLLEAQQVIGDAELAGSAPLAEPNSPQAQAAERIAAPVVEKVIAQATGVDLSSLNLQPGENPLQRLIGDAGAVWRLGADQRAAKLNELGSGNRAYADLLRTMVDKMDERVTTAETTGRAPTMAESLFGIEQLSQAEQAIPEGEEATQEVRNLAQAVVEALLRTRPELLATFGLEGVDPEELLAPQGTSRKPLIRVAVGDLEAKVGAAAIHQDPDGTLVITVDSKILHALQKSGLANLPVQWVNAKGQLQQKSLAALYATFLVPHELTHGLQALQAARSIAISRDRMTDRNSELERNVLLHVHKLDQHAEGMKPDKIWAEIEKLEGELGGRIDPDNVQHLAKLSERLVLVRHARNEQQANWTIHRLFDKAEFHAAFGAFFFVAKVMPVEAFLGALDQETVVALVAQAIESNDEYHYLTPADRQEIDRFALAVSQARKDSWKGISYRPSAGEQGVQTNDRLKQAMSARKIEGNDARRLLALSPDARAKVEQQTGLPLDAFVAGAAVRASSNETLHLENEALGLTLTLAKDSSVLQVQGQAAPRGAEIRDGQETAVLQRARTIGDVLRRMMPAPPKKDAASGGSGDDDENKPADLKVDQAILPVARAIHLLAKEGAKPGAASLGSEALNLLAQTPKGEMVWLQRPPTAHLAKAGAEEAATQTVQETPETLAVKAAIRTMKGMLAQWTQDPGVDQESLLALNKVLDQMVQGKIPQAFVVVPAVEEAVKEALGSVEGKADAVLSENGKAKLQKSLMEAVRLAGLPKEAADALKLPDGNFRVTDLQPLLETLTGKFLQPQGLAVFVSEVSGSVTGGIVAPPRDAQAHPGNITIGLRLAEGGSFNSGPYAVLSDATARSRAERIAQPGFEAGYLDRLKAADPKRYDQYVKPLEKLLGALIPHLEKLRGWERPWARTHAQSTRDAEETRHRDRFAQAARALGQEAAKDTRSLWTSWIGRVARGVVAKNILGARPGRFETAQGLFEAEAGLARMAEGDSALRAIREDLENLMAGNTDEAYWVRVHHNLRAVDQAARDSGQDLLGGLQQAKTPEAAEALMQDLAGKALWSEFEPASAQDYRYAPAAERFGKVVDTLDTKDKDGNPVTVEFHLAAGGQKKADWEVLLAAGGLQNVAWEFARRQVPAYKEQVLQAAGGDLKKALALLKGQKMLEADAPETEQALDAGISRFALYNTVEGWKRIHEAADSVHLIAVDKATGQILASTIGHPAAPDEFVKSFTADELKGTYYLSFWGSEAQKRGIKGAGQTVRLAWLDQVQKLGAAQVAAHARKIGYDEQVKGEPQGEVGKPGPLMQNDWMKKLYGDSIPAGAVVHHAGQENKYGPNQHADEFILKLDSMSKLTEYQAKLAGAAAGLEEGAAAVMEPPAAGRAGVIERAVAEVLRPEKLPKILGMPVLPPGVVEGVAGAMRQPLTLAALNCGLEAALHYVELRQGLEIGSMVRSQPDQVEEMARTLTILLLLHAVEGERGGKSLLYRLAGMEKPAVRVPYALIAPLLKATHDYRLDLWQAPVPLSQSVDLVEQGGPFGTVPGAVYSRYADTGSDGQQTLYFLAEGMTGPAVAHLQTPAFGHAVTLMAVGEELRQRMARVHDRPARPLWVQGPAIFQFDDGKMVSAAGLAPLAPAPAVPAILPAPAAIGRSVLAAPQPGNVANVVKPKAYQVIRALLGVMERPPVVESTPPPRGLGDLSGKKRDRKGKPSRKAFMGELRQRFAYALTELKKVGEERRRGLVLRYFDEIVAELKEQRPDPYPSAQEMARVLMEAAAGPNGWLPAGDGYDSIANRLGDLVEAGASFSEAYVELFGVGAPRPQPTAVILEERGDPSWLNREMKKLAGVYLSGGVTEQSFREFLSSVQELSEQWYGWEDSLQQDGGVYRQDGQGKLVLYLKDGRRKRALDCAEINEHLRRILNGYGITAELYVGRTSAFTRDVFLKGKFQGRTFRATGVPSLNPLEMGEGASLQWAGLEERVNPETMRRLMAQRGWTGGPAVIHLSQLRPMGISRQRDGSHLLELAGLEEKGKHLVATRVTRRILPGGQGVQDISFDRISVPVQAMRLANGKSELSRALAALGKEAGRRELEEALKKAGATIESSGRSSAQTAELIHWMVSVPFDPRPISPSEESRTPDAVIAAHAGFIRWQAKLEILERNEIVVLPDLLLDRISEEALNALAVLPAGLASRVRLLGAGWESFDMARRNPALTVVPEMSSLAATLPAGAAVQVVGVGEDDPLVRELSRLLSRAVTARPVTGGLQDFLWMLGRALGVPEKTIRQELNRLTEALAAEPVIGRGV